VEFKISPKNETKLRDKHGVTLEEVIECFFNRHGKFYMDSRQDHATDPPTYWFVSETDMGRVLKVVFVRYPDFFAIKTAYTPKDGSDTLYEQLCHQPD